MQDKANPENEGQYSSISMDKRSLKTHVSNATWFDDQEAINPFDFWQGQLPSEDQEGPRLLEL